MKKLFLWLVCLCLLLTCSGCQAKTSCDIVATTLPVYEFTTRLCAGTDLSVSQLINENVSCLHDYSLQVRQMQLLQSADMVVISGAGLESFMEDVLTTSGLVVDCSAGIDLLCADELGHDHHEHHDHGEHDPHYWLDPQRAKVMAQNIYAALTAKYPQYTDLFHKNLTLLLADLEALDRYAQEQLSGLSCRELVTFHDGFSYLADACNLTVLEAVEEEAGSETSASKLVEIITLVRGHDLPAIFTETNGSTASASVISAETGVGCYALDMIVSGSSYFELMYQNIDTLKEALE